MSEKLLLDAGSGGRASLQLIESIFYRHFANDILAVMDDAALLPSPGARLAMSTDSYIVTPLFFPGGSIGSLAVHGTVNDVAMLGARPLWLSAAFILEEGLALDELEKVVIDMAEACRRAHVRIVTGDTKVAPAGTCDKMFINTTGIGVVEAANPPSGHRAEPGDVVLVSGFIGDHGLAVMAAREELDFFTGVRSDTAALADMIQALLAGGCDVHCLRDPTRGGLATTLNEIARQSGVGIVVREDSIPIRPEVADGCSFVGLDPLYLANEGKCICVLPKDKAEKALHIMRSFPEGRDAAIIGEAVREHAGRVSMRTRIGGSRILSMLEGAQLPRIC